MLLFIPTLPSAYLFSWLVMTQTELARWKRQTFIRFRVRVPTGTSVRLTCSGWAETPNHFKKFQLMYRVGQIKRRHTVYL